MWWSARVASCKTEGEGRFVNLTSPLLFSHTSNVLSISDMSETWKSNLEMKIMLSRENRTKKKGKIMPPAAKSGKKKERKERRRMQPAAKSEYFGCVICFYVWADVARVVNSMQVVRNDKAPTEHPKCYVKILTFSISTKTFGISVSLSSLRDPRSLCCESDGKITRSLELSFVNYLLSYTICYEDVSCLKRSGLYVLHFAAVFMTKSISLFLLCASLCLSFS